MDTAIEKFLDSGLVPVDEAAEKLHIDPKKLRGLILRNQLNDPIGDLHNVYGWSCRTLYETLASDRENDV